jgi:hypothetical protein
MSLSLNGAFWPTILPLFHGSRRPALTLDPMMDSHQVEGQRECADATSRRVPRACQSPARAVAGSQLTGVPSYSRCRPQAGTRDRPVQELSLPGRRPSGRTARWARRRGRNALRITEGNLSALSDASACSERRGNRQGVYLVERTLYLCFISQETTALVSAIRWSEYR